MPANYQTSTGALLVFAKPAKAGEVKTRLIPELGAAGAAALYRRLHDRVLATAVSQDSRSCNIGRWVTLSKLQLDLRGSDSCSKEPTSANVCYTLSTQHCANTPTLS